MKLIEALVVAHQEYAIYQTWTALHAESGGIVKTGDAEGWYYAYDSAHVLVSQSTRLEPVIADFAEKYPAALLDDRWKVDYVEKSLGVKPAEIKRRYHPDLFAPVGEGRTMQEMILDALTIGGTHHKQWYLWRIAEALEIDTSEIEGAYKGIAP